MTEVLSFLRSITPRINYTRGALNFSAGFNVTGGGTAGKSGTSSAWQNEKVVQAVLAETQLVNGHALGVAFLGNSINIYRHSSCNLC